MWVSLEVIVFIKFDLKFDIIVLNEIRIKFLIFFWVMKFCVFVGSGLGGFGSMGLMIFMWDLKGLGKFKVKLLGIRRIFVVLNILLRFENLFFFM